MKSMNSSSGPRRSRRPPFRSSRAFYITILVLSALAVISLVADQAARYNQGDHYGLEQRRALAELDPLRKVKIDLECRLVHEAEDKCAFIRENCSDEEAGLFSYLNLYYCTLPNAKPVGFIILVVWLAVLFSTIGIAASDFFSVNLNTLATVLGMSEALAGVTLLAIGNGSPDVFSTFAAMSSHSGSMAIGELMGAAGFITTVVAGSMALVRDFDVEKTFVRDAGLFMVAASFSMVFLADGNLRLWECCIMIGFYVVYVIFVGIWDWVEHRNEDRRKRQAAARSQFINSTGELEVADNVSSTNSGGMVRYRDEEDFDALERGSSPGPELLDIGESDKDRGHAAALASEVAAGMRVMRPRGNRRNTLTPIRPSLVGALEFRSVLNSLQRSAGYQRPIYLRRYSDDPSAGGAIHQLDGQGSTRISSGVEGRPNLTFDLDNYGSDAVADSDERQGLHESPPIASPSRGRAVSMNTAAGSKKTDPAAYTVAAIKNVGVLGTTPVFPQHLQVPGESPNAHTTPTVAVTPTSTDGRSRTSSLDRSRSRSRSQSRQSQGPLNPHGDSIPEAKNFQSGIFSSRDRLATESPIYSPRTNRSTECPRLQIPNVTSRGSSRSRSNSQSPLVRFPVYTDSQLPIDSRRGSAAPSIILFDPNHDTGSRYTNVLEEEESPIRWWPYKLLPDPYLIFSMLFPTLSGMRDKTWLDKLLSVASAPSVFMLAITLPVVDASGESEHNEPETQPSHHRIDSQSRSTRSSTLIPDSTDDSVGKQLETEWERYRRSTLTRDRSPSVRKFSGGRHGITGGHNIADLVISTEHLHERSHGSSMVPIEQNETRRVLNDLDLVGNETKESLEPKDWNRWLLSLQIFTAPLFVAVIIWANTDERNPRFLIKLILYSLLVSLPFYGILILTTSADKPPKNRVIFCFVGFVVAVSWIATIANEVVGVLKCLGVIFGISDAILGLTIFAVGNSLGDLVADVTIARLGSPMMALSACFGGPMLNILLGIGIGGLYMTITDANHHHEKHPDKHIKYKPYQVEISGTLIISGVSLILTLLGLLIIVPYNKWMMTRKIGYGLIALWCVTTIVNLVVEISGAWDNPISG
ncbi:Sodium/calcium exchanger protein-domain-containing protein [Calycina marina]|uniref:Sodium/calcium exchanger protein-domain-containing protein n=1 Tax=Calycina marina TaxID=1763456 RepID=A0A9P8CC16_9HELO|nr:Sodium/calcium exchanger protein-domain-containing protein [Calycina marina]